MAAGFGPILGLKIGHARDEAALTGCTVLLCEQGAIAACDVRGGAVGEREIEPLRPGHIV
jgi:L-aminopeptidase/D-esterase-like protein